MNEGAPPFMTASNPSQSQSSAAPPDLFGTVLASVSRSFFLTLRALPKGLRRPVGLAYLLARTSDTIADSATASAETRTELLHQFGQAVHGTVPVPDLTPLIDGIADPPERSLLGHAPLLADLIESTPMDDRQEIIRVLDEIIRGQTLDVRRFDQVDPGEVRALANADELEDYTFSVAGCVGDFWTRICAAHLPNYGREKLAEMLRLGAAFGKGLQLVNILRDMPADAANGRCYLPMTELAMVGTWPLSVMLSEHPEAVRPVFQKWLGRAREHLNDALRYIRAVRSWRVRFACFLPWALGMKTLALLEKTPPLETAARVKVSRKEVRRLLVWGVAAALSNRVLEKFAAKQRVTPNIQ